MAAQTTGGGRRSARAPSRPRTAPTRSGRRAHQRAPNASGRQTRAAILEAAEYVLVKHGHRGMTVRAVASACGISIGNLHYHFASIDDLVVALVDSVLQRYQLEFEQQLSELNARSAGKFIDLAGWLVLDAAKPKVNRLFREFWAMEYRNPLVARAMAAFYSQLAQVLVAALKTVFPNVPQQRLMQIARMMGMLSEGSGILGGCDGIVKRAPARELARIARDAVRLKLSQLEFN